MRSYLKTIIIDYGDRPLVSDEACAERELTRQQCWEILDYLGWRCKDLEKQHGITPQVIDAWMDYLLIAFLVTTGARQRELRELQRQYLTLEGQCLLCHVATGRAQNWP
jgi:integrase